MDKKGLLCQIDKNIKICKKCRLFQKAKNPVPGEGNIDSEVVFVGEAPGEVEDNTGRPFVGKAGKLLEKLLEKIGLSRDDVWIGNVIKHRPPANRDPLPDEISSCEGYLTQQLAAIKPKLVVTLGRFSMNYFYPGGKISRDHGHIIKAGGFNVYPIYHPAAALRSRSVLVDLVKDFVRIPELLKNLDNSNLVIGNRNEKTDTIEGQIGLGI